MRILAFPMFSLLLNKDKKNRRFHGQIGRKYCVFYVFMLYKKRYY